MATQQTLKGGPNKLYSVITDFSSGIDKKTIDDVAVDSSFRELKNFYNEAEGGISKRPGVYDSGFFDFITDIVNENYSSTKFHILDNNLNESKDVVMDNLWDFYDTILRGYTKEKSVTYTGENETQVTESRTFTIDRIVGFQIFKNNKFFEMLHDYNNILNGNYSYTVGSSNINFSCLIVAGGFSEVERGDTLGEKLPGLSLTRLSFDLEYVGTAGYQVTIECNSVDPTAATNSADRKWLYYPDTYDIPLNVDELYLDNDLEYKPLPDINIESYNGASYIATGRDYLIKVEQNPKTDTEIFLTIGNANVYTPTPIELNIIGFNLLAKDPLSTYTKGTGQAKKVKGVFYSVNITKFRTSFKQPITRIPYNGSFNLHVLYTGNEAPSTLQWRPNNGETDVTINAYKDLPGTWEDTAKTIYVVSGIDTSQDVEIKITLGDDTFITYVSPGESSIDETSYINTLNKLIFRSTYLKIIGDQLVLYGRHGYMFFSEYGVFDYFPNYNFVYVANEAGEESITNIKYFRQYYAIFTNKRIIKMSGTFGASDFSISPLNDFIGCPNGRTVRALGNNLFFLGNDGIYKLKQGYIGEGTENVEKVDLVLNNELNLTNVLQAFTMNSNYIIVKNDGRTWFVYNLDNNAFYEYDLESAKGEVYKGNTLDSINNKAMAFYSIFATNLFDANGDFFIVPMYNYTFNNTYTESNLNRIDFMIFRMHSPSYLKENVKHKDGEGFISTFETHALNMGYPTNTKKFKDVYIKIINKSGFIIPLYVTIYVDDIKVLSPEEYVIKYQASTNTYYYVKETTKNGELNSSKVLGELTLGQDPIGDKTIQQLKLRVGESGRSIKLILSDGYNVINLLSNEKGLATRERNLHNFTITSIGIVYKIKKVKEG